MGMEEIKGARSSEGGEWEEVACMDACRGCRSICRGE